jgi:hypothetical protein
MSNVYRLPTPEVSTQPEEGYPGYVWAAAVFGGSTLLWFAIIKLGQLLFQ